MLEAMPWRVFVRWQQYNEVEPFGEDRADLRAAIIAWTMATVMTDKKHRHKLTLESFMPTFKQPRRTPQQTAEQEAEKLLAKVRAINAMLGGSVVKAGDDGE